MSGPPDRTADGGLADHRPPEREYFEKYVLPYLQLRRLIKPGEIADTTCFLIKN